MTGLPLILFNLRAAIAVVAARERSLTSLLVLVWARIGRMGARLERLMALWRAGKLPKPRQPRGPGIARISGPVERPRCPTAPSWLVACVREAAAFGSQLEHLMGEAEFAAFLAEVPQARRILRPLCKMVGVGVTADRVQSPRRMWAPPAIVPVARTAPAGLVLGPGGRLIYV
jgi:hypothetical protein